MRIIKPYAEIMQELDGAAILRHIEICGRVCYKSEDKITPGSAEKFAKMLIERGHEAMIEHYGFSVRFVVDRGVSHEIVRHRLASYAQESTRYCNYGKDGCTFVLPCWFGKSAAILLHHKWEFTDKYCEFTELRAAERRWFITCLDAEYAYENAMEYYGLSPQEARSILPNSLKTELIMTANLREWRHFLRLRTAKDAHPQMREVAIPLLGELKGLIPVVFDDIEVEV